MRIPSSSASVGGDHRVDIPLAGDFDACDPFPYPLALEQGKTLRVLLSGLAARGIAVEWGTTLESLADVSEGDDEGVVLCVSRADGTLETMRTRYLIGADGAHSSVRAKLGIEFVGQTYDETLFLADVDLKSNKLALPYVNLNLTRTGFLGIVPLSSPGRFRLFGTVSPSLQRALESKSPDSVNLEDVRTWFAERAYLDCQPIALHWASAFRSHCRMASRFRQGSCFLVGDAAHIHSPAGGQGMNLGVGDAFNLGWKLALVCRGHARRALLESYEAERKPTALAVLRGSDRAFSLEASTSSWVRFLRLNVQPRVLSALLHVPAFRKLVPHVFSQRWISYRGSPAVMNRGPTKRVEAGDRALPGALETNEGPTSLRELLHGTGLHVLAFPAEGERAPRGKNLAEELEGVMEGSFSTLVTWHMVGKENRALRNLYDVGSEGALVLVRPDGHVGFRAPASCISELAAYLHMWFVPGFSGVDASPTGHHAA